MENGRVRVLKFLKSRWLLPSLTLLILQLALPQIGRSQVWQNVMGATTESPRLDMNVTDIAVTGSEEAVTIGFYGRGEFEIGGVAFAGVPTVAPDGIVIKSRVEGGIAWTKSLRGSGDVMPRAVALDREGNMYVGGYFGFRFPRDTLRLDGNEIAFDSSLGIRGGGFVIKLTPDGEYIWGTSLSGSVEDIAYDNLRDRLYVTGDFVGTATVFDTVLNSIDPFFGNYFYVGAITPEGDREWVRREERGASEGTRLAVTQDGSGDVLVAGYFNDTLIYDEILLARLHVNSSENYFLMRLDGENGNSRWSQALGPTVDGATDLFPSQIHVATSPDGSAYVAGTFFESITLGGLRITDDRDENSHRDVFIAKVDGEGEGIWVERSSTEESNQRTHLFALAVDSSNRVMIGGQFNKSTSFQGRTLLEPDAEGDGRAYDLYVAQFEPTGDLRWAVSAGGKDRDDTEGPIGDYVSALALSKNGTGIVAGVLEFEGSIGSTTIANSHVPTHSLFIASILDPSTSVRELQGGREGSGTLSRAILLE